MAVTLEITFIGLIAFAHDDTNNKLYALFPTTGFLGSSNIHHHQAVLAFDRRYLPAQSMLEGGVPKHAGHGNTAQANGSGQHEQYELIPLGRMRLDFSGLGGSGSEIVPPASAAPLRHFGTGTLDPVQVGNTPRDSVHAQIVLPGADIMIPGDTARWRIGQNGATKLYLSHKLVWKREVPGREVRFTMGYIGAGSTHKPVTLSAEDGDTIVIEVGHVPQPKDDHHVPKDQPAKHFAAYLELFTSVSNAPLPWLDQNPSSAQVREDDKSDDPVQRGPNVFTCMTAQVPVA